MDISTQIEIERSYSKKLVSKDLLEVLTELPNMSQITARFDAYVAMNHEIHKAARLANFKAYMRDNQSSIEDVFAHLMVTLHMTHGECILQSLCGQNSHLAGEDKFSAVTTLAEIVMLMNNVMYTTELRGTYILIKSKLDMPNVLADRINNVSYVPPMVVEPKNYINNYDGGYYEHKTTLLTGKNQHNKKQNLEFINTMNSLPMALDLHIAELPRVAKYSMNTAIKRKNFDKLIADTKRVIITILTTGNKFYFLYRYDSRGRSYASGYQVNPMGDDYSKALINLHKEELIGEDY